MQSSSIPWPYASSLGHRVIPSNRGPLSLENVALSQAVLNIASDLAVIALLIPTIRNLHFSLKRRATVGCLLALGSGYASSLNWHQSYHSFIYSIQIPANLPLQCHHLLNSPPTIRHPPRQDARHNLYRSHPGRVVIVEINLAIICPCAMRFKRPVATYLPGLSLFSSRSHSAAGKTTYSSSVNRFRLDHSQHSYQLHSVQKGNTGPFSDSNGISIHRSFKVDVKGTDRHTGDGESADKILA